MRRAIAPMLLALSFVLAACADRAPEPGTASDRTPESATAVASGVEVTVTVEDTDILTSQRTGLSITTVASEGTSVGLPEIAEALPDWTVTSDGPVSRTVRDGRVTIAHSYRLEPFLPGEYAVPALTFSWTGSEGSASSVSTEPIGVRVTSVLDEGAATDLADIKAVATPEQEIDWWAIALIAAGASAVVAALAALLIRRLTRVRPVELQRIPAHEVALSRLDGIDPTFHNENGAAAFFADVSLIVRTYIEDRFGLHAPERTTEEFLRESSVADGLSREDHELLERFLGLCDLVKFARHHADPSDARGAIDAARGFIERTGTGDRVVVFRKDTGERMGVETVGAMAGGAP